MSKNKGKVKYSCPYTGYMNTTLLLSGVLATILIGSLGLSSAYAQYLGNVGAGGETGEHTLEEALDLSIKRVEFAKANPGAGSGTPYLDASGILGASVISGAIFGGIAGAFMIRSRTGKYAAQGRG